MSESDTRLHAALGDVPAIVGASFSSLHQGRYLLCRVANRNLAKRWLSDVIAAGLVKGLREVRQPEVEGQPAPDRRPSPRGHAEAATVGISHAGLCALGLVPDPKRPFPSAFRAGMGDPVRRRLLGEEPVPAGPAGRLEPWDWSDAGRPGEHLVHLVVAHYWGDACAAGHPLLDPVQHAAQQHGLEVWPVETFPGAFRPVGGSWAMYEPFGFQDGLGQPQLRGLAPSTAEARLREAATPARSAEARRVRAGEFVLGQINEYREPSYSPDVVGWHDGQARPGHFGDNGSYLVVRQIEQHVDRFDQVLRRSDVAQLDSKMMGRHRDGSPLVTGPLPAADRDDFLYLAGDGPGFECPRGAHVRRANPRDALAFEVGEGIASSRLHRLLRRGRVYQNAPRKGSTGDGLMFLALNADLDRQFEFVHRNWIMGSRFGDLADEQDPILGVRAGRMFTVPGCPSGTRVGPLPRFTRVRGGGYFLVPGQRALRFIAGLDGPGTAGGST